MKEPGPQPAVTRPKLKGPRPRVPRLRPTVLLHFDVFELLTYRGVIDWVRENGWVLDAATTRALVLPSIQQVDGILMFATRPGTFEWLQHFNCPIVRLHTPTTPEVQRQTRNLPTVECDFESIGRIGAEHLLTLGRPHFVFYHRGRGPDVLSLRDSFTRTLRAAGHEPSILDFMGDHPARDLMRPTTFGERFNWLARHLAHLPKPMAIMTEDDRFAPDLVEVAHALGLRVPTDVAVLGCDDHPLALGVSPIPISSVDSNCWGVGYAAAALLARLVAGEPAPAEIVRVPARQVVARQSTATYAGAHAGVNLALQHLRQHFRRPLTLAGLARVARMSVRGLQFAYRQETGGTIQDEMLRLRVAAAARLLEETDLKLDAVAADTNLGDAKNLCRVFAKLHGVSPDAWRRRPRAPS